MSSSAENAAEASQPASGDPGSHRQARPSRQHAAPSALASASDSFLNFPFTFEQNLDDAVAASFRIEADVCTALPHVSLWIYPGHVEKHVTLTEMTASAHHAQPVSHLTLIY